MGYNRSKTQNREYSEQMKTLDSAFDSEFSDWNLSSMMDSCYKEFPKYVVRISNHSADNKYHDIQNPSYLLVNIKA